MVAARQDGAFLGGHVFEFALRTVKGHQFMLDLDVLQNLVVLAWARVVVLGRGEFGGVRLEHATGVLFLYDLVFGLLVAGSGAASLALVPEAVHIGYELVGTGQLLVLQFVESAEHTLTAWSGHILHLFRESHSHGLVGVFVLDRQLFRFYRLGAWSDVGVAVFKSESVVCRPEKLLPQRFALPVDCLDHLVTLVLPRARCHLFLSVDHLTHMGTALD
mmetsp:Transcript_34376/g.75044  ORF Transcript_34376/g.75044 Transcript_34376/m.75044 type:complete len:218 (-) Transcript_34376:439-1092(-)